VADKVPCPGPVGTRVEVDPGAVTTPAVARAENGASLVAAEIEGQLSQSWLSAEAPAIDLVGQIGDVGPVRTAIRRLEDGEVVRVVAAIC